MPCETFTSTGASPAFDTTTQELGVTLRPGPAAAGQRFERSRSELLLN